MTTWTIPDPENGEGLLNIGPAGKTFLACRGIAGSLLPDESPVEVDQVAMFLWLGWTPDGSSIPQAADGDDWDAYQPADPDACHECAGTGRVLDGEGCDGCGATGLRGPEPPTVAEMRAREPGMWRGESQ
jgi:hypothetical protein